MRLSSFSVLVACLTVVATVSASAQSLAERRMQADRDAALAHAAELTSKTCGITLKTTFAWSTFDAAEVQQKDPVAWCQAGLDALEQVCGDAMGKQAVASKVKALTCAGAAAPSASLAPDGTLTFSFSLGPNQNRQLVREYLEKNL